MEIDRNKLERITTSLAVILLALMVVILTLVVANYTFSWDLFPPAIEKAGAVIIFATFLTIFASVIINIMINIGRIADEIEGKNHKQTIYESKDKDN